MPDYLDGKRVVEQLLAADEGALGRFSSVHATVFANACL
jgi:hypothetical protein